MGYLGKIPATQGKDAGPALKLDDISGDFDGLTTVFDLAVDGTAVDPHVNNISVYLIFLSRQRQTCAIYFSLTLYYFLP